MQITSIKIGKFSASLKVPFVTALRRVNSMTNIAVEVQTKNGLIGYGEAPPTGVITGDTSGSIVAAIGEHIGPAVINQSLDEFETIVLAIQNSCVHNNSAKAAVEMAVYDLYAQYLDVPLYKLFGAARQKLVTDITISAGSLEQMLTDVQIAQQNGYQAIKIKLGLDSQNDLPKLSAISQEIDSAINIRIDANQAWSPREAVKILQAMSKAKINIEFCEQPVKAHDLTGLKFVKQNSPFPIMADEAIFSAQDALQIITNQAADMLNIKLMKTAGIYNALKIITLAEIYGMQCMIGCMLESKLATSAAVHLACAKSIFTKIDLDGPNLLKTDPIQGGCLFNQQEIKVSHQPGLGISGITGMQYLHCL